MTSLVVSTEELTRIKSVGFLYCSAGDWRENTYTISPTSSEWFSGKQNYLKCSPREDKLVVLWLCIKTLHHNGHQHRKKKSA